MANDQQQWCIGEVRSSPCLLQLGNAHNPFRTFTFPANTTHISCCSALECLASHIAKNTIFGRQNFEPERFHSVCWISLLHFARKDEEYGLQAANGRRNAKRKNFALTVARDYPFHRPQLMLEFLPSYYRPLRCRTSMVGYFLRSVSILKRTLTRPAFSSPDLALACDFQEVLHHFQRDGFRTETTHTPSHFHLLIEVLRSSQHLPFVHKRDMIENLQKRDEPVTCQKDHVITKLLQTSFSLNMCSCKSVINESSPHPLSFRILAFFAIKISLSSFFGETKKSDSTW